MREKIAEIIIAPDDSPDEQAGKILKAIREEIKKVRKANPYLNDGSLCDYCFGFDLACLKILALLEGKEGTNE